MEIDFERRQLEQLSITDLRLRYESVFGEVSTSRHRGYLIKRILWRMQANQFGGLSERAMARAKELANPAELRLTSPSSLEKPECGQTMTCQLPEAITSNQSNLVPGTQLERMYKGQRIIATIMENGVRFNGELYRSLSAVAFAVTGAHWNGKLFFGLKGRNANHGRTQA
jgi:hypothetical protein